MNYLKSVNDKLQTSSETDSPLESTASVSDTSPANDTNREAAGLSPCSMSPSGGKTSLWTMLLFSLCLGIGGVLVFHFSDASCQSIFFTTACDGAEQSTDNMSTAFSNQIADQNNVDAIKNGAKGNGPLHDAASRGNLPEVKKLVEQGADINAKLNNGKTALYYATERRKWNVVRWLVEHGADVNAKRNDGWTVLHIAAGNGNLAVVQYLVEKGADVNAKRNDGWTVLHSATFQVYKDVDLVRYLVEHGADLNAKNTDGCSVLHSAIAFGKWAVVRWLVENGADVTAKDNHGGTVLHAAAHADKLDVVKWLINEKDADVNAKTNDGQTVLFDAVLTGNVEMIRWLIDKGLNVNAKDNYGYTPLDYAADEVVKQALIQRGAKSDVRR